MVGTENRHHGRRGAADRGGADSGAGRRGRVFLAALQPEGEVLECRWSAARVAGARVRASRSGPSRTSSSSVPKSKWCSSCAKTCRSGSGPHRGRPSARCRCSARALSTSAPATTGQPIPEWGYVPSDAPPPQLADVTAQANKGIAEITALMQDIRAGKGTVGKLMTDEQLYAELRQFTASAREVTDGLAQGKGHARPAAEQPRERATARGVAEKPDGHHEQDQRRGRAASAS